MLRAGCVLTKDQAGQSGEILGPRQFFQHATHMEEVDGIGDGGQSGMVGAQRGEPAQDVRITAQLLERLHLRVVGPKEIQEISNSAVVETKCLLIEGRSGQGLGGALKQGCQRMLERRESVHRIGRAGRICCATARAYCSKTSRGEICT